MLCSDHPGFYNGVKNAVIPTDVGRPKLSGTSSMAVANIYPSISLFNSTVESSRIVAYAFLSISPVPRHISSLGFHFPLPPHNFEKVLSGGRCYLRPSHSSSLVSVCLQHRFSYVLAIFSSFLSELSATKTEHERCHACSLLKL